MSKDFLNKLFDLKDKNVLVTGAAGQLGRTICGAYIKAGSRVIGADNDSNGKKKSDPGLAEYLLMDISDKESVVKAFKHIYSKSGRLDMLVNNAGVNVFEPFEERSEKSFDWVTDVNLKGTFLCIQEYAKQARRGLHKGSIVNITSLYGVISPDFRIYTDCNRSNSEVYGAVKAGIIQMTKYFAVHLAQYGIRVNCVSPGGIFNPDSPQGADFIKNYSYRCPMGRMAKAEEMVGGVLYLSSEAAAYTTGQNLVIDGGFSCW